MNLPHIAFKNWRFVIIIVVLVVVNGLISFFTMPRSEDPQIDFAGSYTVAIMPGASPKDLERLVVEPIEEAYNELDKIKRLSSFMGEGFAAIDLEFESDTDPEEKFDEVLRILETLRADMPSELAALRAEKYSSASVNILQLALTSSLASYPELQEHAERLESELRRSPGVRKVEIWGIPDEQVRVEIDLAKLQAHAVQPMEIAGAIAAGNAQIPGGRTQAGGKVFAVQGGSGFDSLSEIKNLPIRATPQGMIRLKDLARVNQGEGDTTHLARFNGKKAVFVTVQQQENTNIFNVVDGLEDEIAGFTSTLPEWIQLHTAFDQSESVEDRLNIFFSNLFQGVVFVGLIVLLAMGLRSAGIVILVIPVSIFSAIGWLDLSGFGLDQISIVGLVIALGLMVDNAIVVVENIIRWYSQGYNESKAAREATSEIGWAVTSSTATTVLAFLPMLLMANEQGKFIRGLPMTVVFTLLASLLVSLMLTPLLTRASLSFRKNSSGGKKKNTWLQRYLIRFSQKNYRNRLQHVLNHPWITLGITGAAFALSMLLFTVVDVSMFPKAEKPQILIDIGAPQGSALSYTNEIVKEVEKVLEEIPEVKLHAANVGRKNPRIYYNTLPRSESPSIGQVLVELKSHKPTEMIPVLRTMRQRFSEIPGAEIEVKEFTQGSPVMAPVAIRITGEDLNSVRHRAEEMVNRLENIEGAVNVSTSSGTPGMQLKLKVDREKAALAQVSLEEFDKSVRAAMTGLPVSSYRDSAGKSFDIILKLGKSIPPSPQDLEKLSIPSRTGKMVPLTQLAAMQLHPASLSIDHFNLERASWVLADVEPGVTVASVTQKALEELEKMNWPTGLSYDLSGEQQDREESFAGMGGALATAILGIFAVLVLQFRSFLQPFIVFAAVPFAVSGAVMALFVTGYTFSFTAFIGLTSLVGIVVNNSIILVDYANQLRQKGMQLTEAITEAGVTRFTPILLTTVTTIAGLMPLVLTRSSMWAPLSWAIIGGLIISTGLTLLVVPVLYKLLSPKS